MSHGDITPANVLVDRRGEVHLIDFSLQGSAVDLAERRSATPAYAPPEWFYGGPAEGSLADAYAVGIILFELLTGEFAFPSARQGVTVNDRTPLDPGPVAPRLLRELIRRLTAPDPRQRMTVRGSLAQLAQLAQLAAPLDGLPLATTAVDPTLPNRGTPSDSPPRQLGRFVVLRRLGAGGMGAVYLAYDPELRREVAVKVLHAEAGSPQDRARLRREAQAMARLSHPNIVGIHDVTDIGTSMFLAMEYVEGKTLAELLGERPRPTWRMVLDLFLAAGRGLAAAHRTGIVHRDFKPANVLVGPDGIVKVTDFGLARHAVDELADEPSDGPATDRLSERAVGLAERAREGFAAAGPRWDDERAEVVRWLQARSRR